MNDNDNHFRILRVTATFIMGVSRTGRMVLEEAERHNLRVTPVESSKKIFPGGLEGIVYEMEEK